MTTELTNEEIVTNLLSSNEILKSKSPYMSNIDGSLGKFLSKIPQNKPDVKKGKYTFINLNSGWKW